MIALLNAVVLAVVSVALFAGAVHHWHRGQEAFALFLGVIAAYLCRRSLYWLDRAFWGDPVLIAGVDHPVLVFGHSLTLALATFGAAREMRRR